ncbi:MAG: hypothetical protein D3922_01140 [Candidatus Electrothrix sp. AR1]|nr:hypothetical protein [Candidatus Electrothrix sp. AR1]
MDLMLNNRKPNVTYKINLSCKIYLFFFVFVVTPAYSNDKKITNAKPNNIYSRPCNHDDYLNRQKLIESLKPVEIKILGYAEFERKIIINIHGHFKYRAFAQFLTEIKKQPEFDNVRFLGREWCEPKYITIIVE